jgi:hypothetical protein
MANTFHQNKDKACLKLPKSRETDINPAFEAKYCFIGMFCDIIIP